MYVSIEGIYSFEKNSAGVEGLTIFFDFELCRVALLWVVVELGHHLPHSGTKRRHTREHIFH